MSKSIVWMKQGVDNHTVRGQTTRTWISRDRKHSKLVVKQGSTHPQSTVVYLVDGVDATPEHRRPDLGPRGPVESTGTWPPAKRIARLDAMFGPGRGAVQERARLNEMLDVERKERIAMQKAAQESERAAAQRGEAPGPKARRVVRAPFNRS